MSFTQTKEYRNLIRKREELKSEEHLPLVRHLIYLIDDFIAKKVELEALKMELTQLDDRIDCAREFVKMLAAAKG